MLTWLAEQLLKTRSSGGMLSSERCKETQPLGNAPNQTQNTALGLPSSFPPPYFSYPTRCRGGSWAVFLIRCETHLLSHPSWSPSDEPI